MCVCVCVYINKLEMLHLDFNSLKICFVWQAEPWYTHLVNLNIGVFRCLGYTIYTWLKSLR